MLKLPTTVLTEHQFTLPSKQMIKDKGANWPPTWPIWKASEVSAAVGGLSGDMMLIAPVPFYTIIDGLDHLDALELAEWLSSLDNAENEPYLQHALVLLTASMVKYPASSKKPHVSPALLTARTALLIPTLPKPQSAPPSQIQTQQDMMTLLQAFIASQQTPWTPTAQFQQNTAPSAAMSMANSSVAALLPPSWPECLVMSETDVDITLALCGLSTSEEDLIPSWFTKIAEKNTSQAAKDRICMSALATLIFPRATVSLR